MRQIKIEYLLLVVATIVSPHPVLGHVLGTAKPVNVGNTPLAGIVTLRMQEPSNDGAVIAHAEVDALMYCNGLWLQSTVSGPGDCDKLVTLAPPASGPCPDALVTKKLLAHTTPVPLT